MSAEEPPSLEEFFEEAPENLNSIYGIVKGDFVELDAYARLAQAKQNISTSSTGGSKEVKQERMDLLPWETLMEVSRVYAFGTQKYTAHNWRKGYEWSKSVAALQRHFSLWVSGEDKDVETGENHLTSVMFHALALLTWSNDPELVAKFDDRYKKPQRELPTFPPSKL